MILEFLSSIEIFSFGSNDMKYLDINEFLETISSYFFSCQSCFPV